MQPEISIKTSLPLSKVIKIMKLHPNVQLVSKDAAKCVQYSTALFLQDLMIKAHEIANVHRRKTINEHDVYDVIKGDKIYEFLEE